MKTEITVLNNLHGIKRLVVDSQDPQNQTLVLIVEENDDSKDKSLGMDLLFAKRMSMSTGKYEMDSFSIRLTRKNIITIKGNMNDAVDMLKIAEFLDETAFEELEKHIKSFAGPSSPPLSDFFSEKSRSEKGVRSSDQEEMSSIKQGNFTDLFKKKTPDVDSSEDESNASKIETIHQIRQLLARFSEKDKSDILRDISSPSPKSLQSKVPT